MTRAAEKSDVPPWERTGAEYELIRAEMQTWYGNFWHRLKWRCRRVTRR